VPGSLLGGHSVLMSAVSEATQADVESGPDRLRSRIEELPGSWFYRAAWRVRPAGQAGDLAAHPVRG